jgi:hypothetical protein
MDLAPELERAAVEIATRRKCGAVVRDGAFHQIKLCCDPSLAITTYPEIDCRCLAEARRAADTKQARANDGEA